MVSASRHSGQSNSPLNAVRDDRGNTCPQWVQTLVSGLDFMGDLHIHRNSPQGYPAGFSDMVYGWILCEDGNRTKKLATVR